MAEVDKNDDTDGLATRKEKLVAIKERIGSGEVEEVSLTKNTKQLNEIRTPWQIIPPFIACEVRFANIHSALSKWVSALPSF